MHLFEVIALDVDDIPTLPVFAVSYDMAVHYYAVWWMHHRHGDLPDLEVRKRNPGWPGLDRTLLASALQLDIAGVGRFDDNIGWTISSPDHENLGAL